MPTGNYTFGTVLAGILVIFIAALLFTMRGGAMQDYLLTAGLYLLELMGIFALGTTFDATILMELSKDEVVSLN